MTTDEQARQHAEASRRFLAGQPTSSAEQLAIAMMKMADRLFHMGGTIGEDEHGFRNMGHQLAGWASDVRELGIDLNRHRESHKEQWEEISLRMERLITAIRQLCETDGSNRTVQAIRKAIDDATFS